MSVTPASPATKRFKSICIVLNPVSGLETDTEAALRTFLETVEDVEWRIDLTEGAGDAARFAGEAAKSDCDLVLACGGDGTVLEVAEGLLGSETLMAILPNGTANVMSVELGYPQNLERILEKLLLGEYTVKNVDVAKIDNRKMLLRAGLGYEAEISVGATREGKRKFGRLAYFQAAWRKLRGLRPVNYKMLLDGKIVAARGVTCMICNSANVGLPHIRMAAEAAVDDGLLDIIIIPSLNLPSVISFGWSIVRSIFPQAWKRPSPILHWQAREVVVETSRSQTIAVDGERLKRGRRLEAGILPQPIRIAVPE
ncbi:MAG: diacylglycerol kinase family lipid kinase [Anaerolineae bacterium]